MALIKCPECGTEVSSSALACPKCAFPINDWVKEQEKESELQKEAAEEAVEFVKREQLRKERERERIRLVEERNKRLKVVIPKIIIFVLIVVIIVVAIVTINNKVIIPRKEYQNAISLMEAGDYEKAITKFDELNNNGKYTELIKECYYFNGEELSSRGIYPGAINSYEKAGDYKDAKEKIENTKNRQISKEALKYIRSGHYYQAEPLIQELRNKGYQFSSDEETEIGYAQAIKKGLQSLSEAAEILKNFHRIIKSLRYCYNNQRKY